jgi:uncharacterized protein YlzI (FlbEa/FlbD family)
MTKLIKLKDSYGDIYINSWMIESLVQQKMEGTNSTIINMMSGRTHIVKHSVKEVRDLMEGKKWSAIYERVMNNNNVEQPEEEQ